MPKKSSGKKNAAKPKTDKSKKKAEKAAPEFSIEQALASLQQGNLAQAQQVCESLLKTNPEDMQAHYISGMVAVHQGQPQPAYQSFSNALRLAPDNVSLLNDFGVFLKQIGQPEKAEPLYRKAIALQPDFAHAYSNLGNIYLQRKQLQNAKACYQKALTLKPDIVDAYVSLGIVLLDEGDVQGCVRCCQKALSLNPNLASAYNVLGNASMKTHQPEQAKKCYEKAIQLNPKLADSYNNLGNLYNSLGEYEKAHDSFQAAIRIKPDYAEVYNNLGLLANTMKQPETAINLYQKAISLKPTLMDSYVNLGLIYQTRWEMDKARECYDKAIQIAPANGGVQMRRLLTIPPFFNTVEEIDACRSQLMERLEALQDQPLQLKNQVSEVGGTPFYLAYHGTNDVALQTLFGRIFARSLEKQKVTLPYHRNKKPLIGFVSAHLYPNHTIGKLNIGTIANLSRDKFDVAVFHIGPQANLEIDAPVTQYSLTPGDVPRASQIIANAKPDVLIYTDIGMDATSYFLAFNRLAPVQCVTWGHPMTTGCSEIDYFISSSLYETEQGQSHYIEQLVQLADLNTCYTRPEASPADNPTFNRAHYGLQDVEHMYLCPQTLFKLHPEFDAILAGILRQDPQGTLVLLEGSEPQWKAPLLARFEKTIPDVIDRIRFIPKMSRQEFINLMALTDVMLDPIHFGGGNTSLEALAQGTPIVTLPSDYLRARLTYGFYKKMGVMDCVVESPEDYIQKAVKLGTDAAYHQSVKTRILEKCAVLYNQTQVATELETFLLQALDTAAAKQPVVAAV